MANTVAIDVKINALEAAQSLKELNQGIKDARNQLAGLEVGSAEFNKLAGAIDDAKDRVEEINRGVEQVGLAGKFSAIAKAGAGIAAGFEVAQGAMALFGSEGEEVEKALQKVQAAMALAQGLSEISEMGKAFGDLKNIGVGAFNAIKTSITSTGIGAVVVAIGLALAALMTYWDDIKEAVTGVSEAQKKLSKESMEAYETEKKKLQAIKDSENILKLQGKTEKEILQSKIKQIDAEISKGVIAAQNRVAELKSQIAMEQKWYTFVNWFATVGTEIILLPWRSAAGIVDLIILQWNTVASALGKDTLKITTLNEQLTKLRETAAQKVTTFLFDPKKTAEDGAKEIQALEDAQKKLLNERAGYQNNINDIDKKAAEDAKKKAEDAAKLQEELNKELARLRVENIDEQRKADLAKAELDFQNTKKEYETKYKGLQNLNQLLTELENQYLNQKAEINNKYNIEEDKIEKEKQQKKIDRKIEEINEERRLIEKDRTLTTKELIDFENRLYAVKISNTKLTNQEIEKIELEHKQNLKNIEDNRIKNEIATIENNYNRIKSIREIKIQDEIDLENNKYAVLITNTLLNQQELEKLEIDHAVKLKELKDKQDKEDQERRKKNAEFALNTTQTALQTTSDLIGAFAGKSEQAQKKAFEQQKALSIASAIISTYQNAVTAYQSQFLPLPDPTSPIRGAIAATVAVATGIANIRKIEQTTFQSKETPSGGAAGGGGGGGSFAPNLSAPVGNTSTNLASIGFGQDQQPEPVKVFVTETDISSSQKNVQKIEQKASIE